MSAKNVKAFFEKAAEDRKLQAQLIALDRKIRSHREKEFADLIKVAAKAGYEFTAKDFAAEKARLSEVASGKAGKERSRHAKLLGSKKTNALETAGGRCWFCEDAEKNVTGHCTFCDTAEKNTTGHCTFCDTACENACKPAEKIW